MNIEEVKQYLSDNKDADDVKAFLGTLAVPETDIIAKYKASKDYTDELKREGDRRATAAVEKFSKDTMPKHVEEEIKKRFPDETAEQKKLRELQKTVDDLTTERQREAFKNKAMKSLTDKKLSLELLDFINANDDDELTSKIDKLHSIIAENVTVGINDKLKGAASDPAKSASGSPSGIITSRDGLKGLTSEQINKLAGEGRINIPGVNLELLKAI